MADTSNLESGQDPWVPKAFASWLNASARQDTLIHQLDVLRESLGEGVDEDTERAFANIYQLVRAQDQEISHALSVIPDPLKATARSTELAYEVFGTVELLEEILSNLGFRELLGAYLVARPRHNVIEGSLRLQRQLHLRPDPDQLFTLLTPSRDTHIGYVQPPVEPDKLEWVIPFSFELNDSTRRHGSRLRSMLISQPPVRSLKMEFDCCSERQWGEKLKGMAKETIHAAEPADGITLGDLDDTVERITRVHQMCPHAPPEMHDNEGFVRVRIYCEGEYQLGKSESDLLWEDRERELQEREERQLQEREERQQYQDEEACNCGRWYEEWHRHQNRIQSYVDEKRRGG
jgi:hypothetical protein